MSYNFTKYAPFILRGKKFPDNIIRVSRSSLTISKNIVEQFGSTRFTLDNGQERVQIVFQVDQSAGVIALEPSKNGYTLQVRENGNAYLNTSRMDSFGLVVGDYILRDDNFFHLA